MTINKKDASSFDFIARHYRGIIFTLVLINTALIVFLLVYIWTFGATIGRSPVTEAASVASAVILTDRQIVWSKPGGLRNGASSRGVVQKGNEVRVHSLGEFESERWVEVSFSGRIGWVPEKEIKYLENQP